MNNTTLYALQDELEKIGTSRWLKEFRTLGRKAISGIKGNAAAKAAREKYHRLTDSFIDTFGFGISHPTELLTAGRKPSVIRSTISQQRAAMRNPMSSYKQGVLPVKERAKIKAKELAAMRGSPGHLKWKGPAKPIPTPPKPTPAASARVGSSATPSSSAPAAPVIGKSNLDKLLIGLGIGATGVGGGYLTHKMLKRKKKKSN